jgi:23S rRNA (uracil1939-C5)-methyltransferase
MEPGSILTLDIDKAAAGGRMLGRHHGRVVLVWGAIPGERVRARIERVGKGVLYAETIDVLSPSPDRRAAEGDWRCGGNVLAHVDYHRQLRLKGEIVQDAFRRIARVPLAELPQMIGSPEAGYRMRARLHASHGRLGFYREGTHQLCDAAATAQLLPATNAWISSVEDALRTRNLTGLAGIELAENIGGNERACHLELHDGVDAAAFTALADGLVGLSAQRADRPEVALLAGTPVITDILDPADGDPPSTVRLRRDVRAFFQGNRFLLERLVRQVADLAAAGPIIDLYAGVGLFGLSLAAAGADDVTVVEGDPVSGADLKINAEPFAHAVRVKTQSVESYLASAAVRPAATCIVDPPRTGVSRESLAGIVRMNPGRIVYVSCDVATLARDTRTLLDSGYELASLSGMDLFPNTAHVESIALFTRQPDL